MQIINLNHLYYFSIIAKVGSISKAAKDLYVTQPALSHQLKQLEDSLGCKLFDRRGRSLLLNKKGEYLLGFANHIFRESENMISKIKSDEPLNEKNVIIGVENGISQKLVLDIIRPYSKADNMTVSLLESSRKELGKMLIDKRVDVVLSSASLDDPDITLFSIPVRLTKFVLVAPTSLDTCFMDIRDIFNHFPVIFAEGKNSRKMILDNFMKKHGILKNKSVVHTNSQVVTDYLLMGEGIGIVSDDEFKNSKSKKCIVLDHMEDSFQYIYATYLKENSDSQMISGPINHAYELFQQETFH